MPTKPNKDIINACKKNLDPRDVLCAVISDTPELRDAAIAAGVVEVVDDGEDD